MRVRAKVRVRVRVLGCRAERLLHVMPEASARAWRARHAGELAPLENLDDLTQPQPVAPLGQ